MKARKTVLICTAICLTLGALYGLYTVALGTAFDAEHRRSITTARLYAESLRGSLNRRRHLPEALTLHPDIQAITKQPGDKDLVRSVNIMLEGLAEHAQAEAIYILNRTGLTVASSNWRRADTFIGHRYNFRSYFVEAIEGRSSSFFAIGATTGRPGAFFSEPIQDTGGTPLGVVVIKIDMTELERSWNEGGEYVLVSNADGVVVLSSKKEWKYGTLTPLSTEQRETIEDSKQFAKENLSALPITRRSSQGITIDQERFLKATINLGWRDWKLHLLSPYGTIQQQAWFVVLIAVSGLTIIALFYAIMQSQRFKSALVTSQSERAELERLTADLKREVQERRQAEKQLRKAQAELNKTATLAALGQLAASVSHELGQPLSAMKTYLSGADNDLHNGRPIDHEAIARLQRLTERMNGTTRQLKFFARRGGEPMKHIDLRDVVAGALETVQPALDEVNIALDLIIPDQPLTVLGGRNRLEQVLINLLRNAVQATQDCDKRQIVVQIETEADMIKCQVKDSGNGLSNDVKDKLFDPFVTTRVSGEGMGLGLAISASIVHEHGGHIDAQNAEMGGAKFVVHLPSVKPRPTDVQLETIEHP